MNYVTELKNNFPIIFRILKNSFDNKKISHAFLFYGGIDVDVTIPTFALASALISDEGVFENPELSEDHTKYPDLQTLGSPLNDETIKKNDVINALEQLSLTTLDNRGIKILIIHNLENASIESINSLLKSVEEPSKKTYIIINTNNIYKIPAVIRSRSLEIKVKSNPQYVIKSFLIQNGASENIANILSTVSTNTSKLLDILNTGIDELYEGLFNGLKKGLSSPESIFTSFVALITKTNDKLFMHLLLSFVKDILKYRNSMPVSNVEHKDIIRRYSDNDFSVEESITLINDYLLSKRSNVNFNLYKNKFLIEFVRLYV